MAPVAGTRIGADLKQWRDPEEETKRNATLGCGCLMGITFVSIGSCGVVNKSMTWRSRGREISVQGTDADVLGLIFVAAGVLAIVLVSIYWRKR